MKREWLIEEQIRRALNRMAEKEAALATAVYREPCFLCGTKYADHDQLGCRRFVG
jgi:hypothetical protein